MKVTIPITPVAKARARTVSREGKTWTYTPADTQKTMDDIMLVVRTELNRRGVSFAPHTPLEAIVTFWVKQPKRCLYDYPVVKPDLKNYYALLEDALNGVVWPDDAQIVHIDAWKRYTEGQGFIDLEIREIKNGI